MHILDTNVLSELYRRNGELAVRRWVNDQRPANLFLSVITTLEIEIGILGLQRRDPVAAESYLRWYEQQVLPGFRNRILALDFRSAQKVAPLHVPDRAPQHDALIAGTALAHGMQVITRNTEDFERFRVPCFNPWSRPR